LAENTQRYNHFERVRQVASSSSVEDLRPSAVAMAVALRGGLVDTVTLHADRGCTPADSWPGSPIGTTWPARSGAPVGAGIRAGLHGAPPGAGWVWTRFLRGLPCQVVRWGSPGSAVG